MANLSTAFWTDHDRGVALRTYSRINSRIAVAHQEQEWVRVANKHRGQPVELTTAPVHRLIARAGAVAGDLYDRLLAR